SRAEDPRIGHDDLAATLRLGEAPAPDPLVDAATHRAVGADRVLLDDDIGNVARPVDGELDGDLPFEARILLQLLLVAEADLALIAPDDVGDHAALQAADHGGAAGDDLGGPLGTAADGDAVATATATALGSEATEAEATATTADTHAAGAEAADAVGIAHSRAGLQAAERVVDAGAQTASAEDVAGRITTEAGEKAGAPNLLNVRSALGGVDRALVGLLRLGLRLDAGLRLLALLLLRRGEIELRLRLLLVLHQRLGKARAIAEVVVLLLKRLERSDEQRREQRHVDHHRDGEELGEVEVHPLEEAGLLGFRGADEARHQLDRADLDAGDVAEVDGRGGSLRLLAAGAANHDLAPPRRLQFRAAALDAGQDEATLVLQIDLEVGGVVAADGHLPVAKLPGLEDGVTPDQADRESALLRRRPELLRKLLVEEQRGRAQLGLG